MKILIQLSAKILYLILTWNLKGDKKMEGQLITFLQQERMLLISRGLKVKCALDVLFVPHIL